jgi:tetratricopeptide (TPR) repeat protein
MSTSSAHPARQRCAPVQAAWRAWRNGLAHVTVIVLLASAPSAIAAPKPVDAAPIPQIIHRPPDRATLTSDQKKAETNVAKILAHAQSALQVGDYASAVSNYKDALEIFEQAYGPTHERLAEPLSGIVNARLTQYISETAQRAHPSTAGVKAAADAQKRIVDIYDAAKDIDPVQHVDAKVTLGDLYLYIPDNARGVASYRAAYQLQSSLASPDSAEEMFSQIKMINLFLPANPPSHDDWEIKVAFDVAPDGRVSVVDYQSNANALLNKSLREAYGRASARPRFRNGEPVKSELMASYVYRTNTDITIRAVQQR